MFKKFCWAVCCLMLASCSSNTIKDEGGADSFNTDIAEIGISTSKSFRVGMLLPLSGKDAKYGIGLKNASMIALNNVNNPNLVLQYYDTQSSPSGARIAVENAINQQSDLIIGPLKSQEVHAVSNETIYQGIPVIAFSTAQEVLQPTIYTLGLLVDEQVDRIISFAAQQGRQRFALLLPDNGTGAAVAKAAVKSAQKNNVVVSKIGFYKPGSSDFSQIAKDMTNYETRHARVVRLRNQLQNTANAGDAHAQLALKKLTTREGLGDVGFDALIVPESGAKLTAAISMFAYYDASYPQVQFLGTALWDGSRLNKEAVIVNGLYPAITKPLTNNFANQYFAVFGEKPSSLYTLAYDAVGIANVLASAPKENINDIITENSGFDSINGKVRFFKDGSNQHSLNVVQVKPTGNIIVDSAGRYFETAIEPLPAIIIDSQYQAPELYAKDASLAQIIIYGQILPEENTQTSFDNDQKDQEAVSEQLRDMGIYIN